MKLLDLIFRYGQEGALVCLAIAGMAIFAVYYSKAFPNGGGKQYEYSSPLSAMWAGIGTMWFTVTFLAWWFCSRDKVSSVGLAALRAWSFFSILFAVEGFVAMIGWAVSQNEQAAAGLSFFWIACGIIAFHMCFKMMKEKKVPQTDRIIVGSEQDEELPTTQTDEASQGEKGSCTNFKCCCTCRFWIDFVLLLSVAILMIFSTGYMIQATWTASDTSSLSIPGEIYSFQENGVTLNMHLYCFGNKNSSSTVLHEHGGGANSIAMLGLAREIESNYGNRVCIYDRLGYGFSPSYYTSSGPEGSPTRPLANSGVILSRLLDKAGEIGPFVCAGHSAGAEACLWFAHERQGDVTGVAMLDGYPDLIRAGSWRPAEEANAGILPMIKTFSVLIASTGLTRGMVGDPGPKFAPLEERATVTKLYGQTRFWFAQYWDVKASLDLEEESMLYQKLGGFQNEDGLYVYGGTLSGVKVVVIPSHHTVTPLDCSVAENANEYCCGSARGSDQCQNDIIDSALYRNQSDLYASTLSSDVEGLVIAGPEGSEHNFVNELDYYKWIAQQIGAQLLS